MSPTHLRNYRQPAHPVDSPLQGPYGQPVTGRAAHRLPTLCPPAAQTAGRQAGPTASMNNFGFPSIQSAGAEAKGRTICPVLSCPALPCPALAVDATAIDTLQIPCRLAFGIPSGYPILLRAGSPGLTLDCRPICSKFAPLNHQFFTSPTAPQTHFNSPKYLFIKVFILLSD